MIAVGGLVCLEAVGAPRHNRRLVNVLIVHLILLRGGKNVRFWI